MTEKISLRLFWLCMLTCAFSTIAMFWMGENPESNRFFLIVPTTFILGLASALIWLPHIIYRFIDAVGGKSR